MPFSLLSRFGAPAQPKTERDALDQAHAAPIQICRCVGLRELDGGDGEVRPGMLERGGQPEREHEGVEPAAEKGRTELGCAVGAGRRGAML